MELALRGSEGVAMGRAKLRGVKGGGGGGGVAWGLRV